MYKVEETIIVEGLYDKIKLSQLVDGVIFVTNGFTVFTNEDMQKTIKELGSRTGIVILTDSDSAGFRIRSTRISRRSRVRKSVSASREGKEYWALKA